MMKSVWDLMEMNFFIPNYQRGYKWEAEQVEDLLDDIYDFYTNSKSSFYCLQPLVVKKCTQDEIKKYDLQSDSNNNEWYEVIDGQQRLTTIKIMLKYLEHIECECTGNKTFKGEYGKNHYVLEYQRNKETKQFIDSLNLNKDQNPQNVDCEYIYDAFKTIFDWVANKCNSDKLGEKAIRERIFNPIVNIANCKKSIQFIYYEIDKNENPIEVFRRLNSGKISLTDAELVKALFILNVKDNLKVEIANEWDKIENTFRKDDFWSFMTSKSEDKNINYQRNRICLLFELIIMQINKDNYNKKQYKYFSMFEKLINDANADKDDEKAYVVWKTNVRKIFNVINYWYNDNVIYNYVGYMINSKIKLTDIMKIWNESKNREDFIEKIKDEIKNNLNCKYIKDEEMGSEDDGYYIKAEYCDKKVEKLLLLLNVQHSILHANNEEKNARFDFQAYRKSWNIEHIDSKTENNYFDKDDRIDWLNNELQVLDDDKLKEKVNNLINSIDIENNEKFLQLKEEIENFYGETGEKDDKFKNNVCNLALLGETENKSYGNNTFPVKRRKIIEWDKTGRFIPICTRYCFLKYFSNQVGNLLKWTKEDKIEYNKYIFTTLKSFLELDDKGENDNE